jgi:radical SAM protein with 4Fe4S-binding SPASM domain
LITVFFFTTFEALNTIQMNGDKIGLFTIAVGKDPVYFESVRRYLPYNRKYFGQSREVDYFLFTDRGDTIEGMVNIPCSSTVWPYAALLKNNTIADFLNREDKWREYTHIFFIDVDFALGDYYDFFNHDFVTVQPYWNEKIGGGFFYGGKTEYFKKLCDLFYTEIQYIYENKLSVPHDLDEFYLGLFRAEYAERVHLIKMDRQTNTLIFYDNEDLDEKIQQQEKRLFMQPYKAEGRANRTIVTDVSGNRQEYIVNLTEQYIFNNYTYDVGWLLKLDDVHYRILWNKSPEIREVLNIETKKISKQPSSKETAQLSPVLSIVMPVYNVPPDYLRESINSILEQIFGDFELLIIDDGSTELEGIEGKSLCYTHQDILEENIKSLQTGENNAKTPHLPGLSMPCMYRTVSSMAIDSTGNIYRCLEHLGDPHNKIGNLLEGKISFSKLVETTLGDDPFEDNDCTHCHVFPVCGGGCPLDRLNKKEGKLNSCCSLHKEGLADLLPYLYERQYKQ